MKLGDILGTISPAYGMASNDGLGGKLPPWLFGLGGMAMNRANLNPMWMMGGLGGIGLGALLHHHKNNSDPNI